ncbi:MAG: Mur ligase, partial [Dokdonella sp.]|nr:Mur ligase [Dokdonella sp.]
LRGRTVGEVPALLREELLRRGLRDEKLVTCLDEYTAVRTLLAWARPGDTLVLPIHGKLERPKVGALLAAMQAMSWVPGDALPEPA